ncbi:MAG: translation initiation factor IF-6 [archaeon]
MHIEIINYQGHSSIGLFCYANDKYCLVPKGIASNLKKKFEEVLNIPVHEMTAAGTDLLGVFFAGNDDVLLVPKIMFEHELRELKRLKINYRVFDTDLTALGNNLIVGNACIASHEYDADELKFLEKELKIPVKHGKIAELDTVGSLAVLNKKGCLVSPDIKEFEKKFLKDNLKLNIMTGTLNFGSPYVSSGIVCNSNGFLVGEMSGGPEIQNADIALGFLEE